MPTGLASLNITYLIASLFQALSGVHISEANFSGHIFFFVEVIGVIGMVLSVVLVVLIIIVRIRLEQVEHEGFAMLAEHEQALRARHTEAAKNPQWEMVSSLASSPNESDWRRAILEADIMLANLLTERGYAGGSLGEQLKNANPLQFTTLDAAWEAHRMRNALAHLGDAFPINEHDVRATIDQYRRVFEEFEII
ncbi:MAG: hypothetical protein WCI89_03370 [bacterium]